MKLNRIYSTKTSRTAPFPSLARSPSATDGTRTACRSSLSLTRVTLLVLLGFVISVGSSHAQVPDGFMLYEATAETDIAQRLKGSVRKQVYTSPTRTFSVPLPKGLDVRVNDSYDEKDGIGAVSLHNLFGVLHGVHFLRIPPSVTVDATVKRRLLEEALQEAAMPMWSLPASQDAKILHQEPMELDGEGAFLGLVSIPGGSPMMDVRSGKRLDSTRAVLTLYRQGYLYFLTTEVGDPLRFRKEPSDVKQMLAKGRTGLIVLYRSITFHSGSSIESPQTQVPNGFALYEGHKAEFTIALPKDWKVYDQFAVLTGKSSPVGMVVFTSQSPEGLDLEEQLGVLARMDTGELPSFFVDRQKAIRSTTPTSFPEKAQKEVAKLIQRSISGTNVEPPLVEATTVGGCQGVHIRMNVRKKDGTVWLADVRAASDGKTLYIFSLRNIKANFERNLTIYEKAMATLRLAKAPSVARPLQAQKPTTRRHDG